MPRVGLEIYLEDASRSASHRINDFHSGNAADYVT